MAFRRQELRENIQRQARQAFDRSSTYDNGPRSGPAGTINTEFLDNSRYLDITEQQVWGPLPFIWNVSAWGG